MIYSQLVRSTNDSLQLSLASEVKGGLVGLSPEPVESDSISAWMVSESSWIVVHPLGVGEKVVECGKTPLCIWVQNPYITWTCAHPLLGTVSSVVSQQHLLSTSWMQRIMTLKCLHHNSCIPGSPLFKEKHKPTYHSRIQVYSKPRAGQESRGNWWRDVNTGWLRKRHRFQIHPMPAQ